MRPAARREVGGHLQVAYDISERRACLATGFGRSSQRYRKRSDPQVALRSFWHPLLFRFVDYLVPAVALLSPGSLTLTLTSLTL